MEERIPILSVQELTSETYIEEKRCGGRCLSRKTCNRMLIALIVMVAISATFVVLLYTLGPLLAGKAMEQAGFVFKTVNITQPGSDRFAMGTVVEVSNPSYLSAVVEPSVFTVSYQSIVLGNMTMPSMRIAGGQLSQFSLSSEFYLQNVNGFSMFAHDLVFLPNVTWTLSSSLTVRALGVTFSGISFVKNITLEGCDGLSNVTVSAFNMSESTATAIKVSMTASIMNPSVFTIDPLGDLLFDLVFNHSKMGSVFASDVILHPGVNVVPLNGELHPEDMSSAATLISRYFSGNSSVVSAVANTSSIELFSAALHGLELTTELAGDAMQLLNTVEFKSMHVKPVDNTSLLLSGELLVGINNPLGSESPINILTVSMEVAMLDESGNELGTFHTDRLPVHDGDQPVVRMSLTDVIMTLNDDGAPFAKLMIDAIQASLIEVQAVGVVSADIVSSALGPLSLSGLPAAFTASIEGMHGLQNTSVIAFDLPANYDDTSIEVTVNASLYNPSVVGVDIGRVALDILVPLETGLEFVHVGRVYVDAFSLLPGLNVQFFEGYLRTNTPEHTPAIAYVMSRYATGISTPVRIRGAPEMFTPIEWMRTVLLAFELSSELPGGNNLTLMTDLNLVSTLLIYEHTDTDHPIPYVTETCTVHFNSPFGFPLEVTSARVNISFHFQDVLFAQVFMPWQEVGYDNETEMLFITLVHTPISIVNHTIFALFVAEEVITTSSTVLITGIGDVAINTAVGPLIASGMTLNAPVTLEGANSFSNPPVNVSTVHMVAGYEDCIEAVISVILYNPSSVALNIGSISFKLYYKDVFLINATLNPFKLDLGPNYFDIPGFYVQPKDPEGQKLSREFLSTFSVGLPTNLTLRGDPEANRVEDFHLMLTEFASPVQLPGLDGILLQKADMLLSWTDYLGLFTGLTKKILTKAWLFNPFDCPVYVTGTDLQAVLSSSSAALGYFQANLTAKPIILEPQVVTVTTELYIRVYHVWNRAMLEAFWNEIMHGSVLVNVAGSIEMKLGDFTTGLDYYQNNIPVGLGKKKADEE